MVDKFLLQKEDSKRRVNKANHESEQQGSPYPVNVAPIFDSKMVWKSMITESNVDKKAEPFLPSPLRIECRTNSYFLLLWGHHALPSRLRCTIILVRATSKKRGRKPISAHSWFRPSSDFKTTDLSLIFFTSKIVPVILLFNLSPSKIIIS